MLRLIAVVLLAAGAGNALALSNDPMRPVPRPARLQAGDPARAAPAPRNWVLTSTLVGGGRQVAVINNRLVGVGDRVAGATVESIAARSATLRYAGNRLVLELGATARRATANHGAGHE